MAKEYFWIKLSEGFFDDSKVKLIRALPDGDSLCIIYQRMMIMCLKDRGYYRFNHILPSAAEEIAAILGEDSKKVTYAFTVFQNMGIVELLDDDVLYISAVEQFFGKETDSAQRVRRMRERQQAAALEAGKENSVTSALQCNEQNVTSALHCNIDILDISDIKDDTDNIDDIDNIYNNINNSSRNNNIRDSKITAKEFVSRYNEICCSLPKVVEITNDRRALMKQAVDILRNKNVLVETFLKRVEQSDFLCGRIKGKTFRASFEFILEPKQVIKIIEGMYDNSTGFDDTDKAQEFDFDQLVEKPGESL